MPQKVKMMELQILGERERQRERDLKGKEARGENIMTGKEGVLQP